MDKKFQQVLYWQLDQQDLSHEEVLPGIEVHHRGGAAQPPHDTGIEEGHHPQDEEVHHQGGAPDPGPPPKGGDTVDQAPVHLDERMSSTHCFLHHAEHSRLHSDISCDIDIVTESPSFSFKCIIFFSDQ